MNDWLERLKVERAELSERIKKLKAFLAEVDKDEMKRLAIDGYQLQLMHLQLSHMLAYLSVIDLRIEAAE